MSEKNNKYTPNLRFPEFSGEWEEKKLGEFFHLQNGYAFRSDAYIADGKYKIVTIANVQSGKLDLIKTNSLNQLPSNIANHQKLNIGDIILSMTGNVGRVCMVDQDNCLLNQRVGLLKQTNENIDRRYVYSLINSKQFETAMVKSGQGAAQANISKEDVESYSFGVPPTPAEQQKIASCLSAMDDLIAAQADKVEALKEKKTGLMQQLFPQPGETTPRLRFPEFTGEWKEKKLGEVASSFSGGTPKSSESKYYGGDIPFIRSGEIHGCKTELYITEEGLNKSSAKLVSKGDLLIALYGATSGEVAISKIDGAINQAILCVRSQSINSNYLCNYLEYKKDTITSKFLQGGQGNLSSDIIMSLNIPSPSPAEQEKIASCLSTLDDQIAAETEKLTALKDYKKGLMQQLFPQPAK